MAIATLLSWLTWPSIFLLSIYILDVLSHKLRHLPPGPRSLPLIGSLHLLSDQPHRSLASLAKTYGPLMSLRLGTVTTVVVTSPELAREFLHKNDAAFSARSVPDATGEHAKHSVAWLPRSPQWSALRRIMATELFAPHRLSAHESLRRDMVADLVGYVGRQARAGPAVDVGRVVFTASLNLLSRTVFSRELASLDADGGESTEFRSVTSEILEGLGKRNVSDFFPVMAWADLQGTRRRLAKVLERLHRVIDDEVDRRLRSREAGEPEKNDFLDALLNDVKAGLDRDAIRSVITDIFLNSPYCSTAVEWIMVELLRNPLSMARATEELAQILGTKRNIEEAEIGKLPYLQAVVKEAFRLHPPAPLLLPRQAETTISVAGYTIPKGARVLVNVWATGRDKEIWDEPEKFMPERFMESTINFKGGNFELIPFGSGRRICPGMPLASKMAHLILASLLNQFKWSLPAEVDANGIDMTEKFGVNLKKAEPLRAIATPV
ncbi:hypothetical protein EJB05_12009, partial [Eragrostis curvula]